MAAPLKGSVLWLNSCGRRLTAPCVRCISSKRKDGPPPWQAQLVPSGRTSHALQMTRIHNKDLWIKRMAKVNRPWKETLIEYNKEKKAREEAAATTEPSVPPKLLMVRLVKTLCGRPHWEKETVKRLKLEPGKPVIVKNKEITIGQLKKVNHLVEIHPVTFPYGLPETEEDYAHCVIRDNGEFVVTKRLKPHGENENEMPSISTEQPESVWDIKQKLIDDTLERKKVLYQVHQEYYPSRYMYKRNEDKKEYRYKGNHTTGTDRTWY